MHELNYIVSTHQLKIDGPLAVNDLGELIEHGLKCRWLKGCPIALLSIECAVHGLPTFRDRA